MSDIPTLPDPAPIDPMEEDIDNTLEAVSAEPTTKVEMHPVFKKYADSKIPVSKSMGGIWKSRRNAAKAVQSKSAARWEEAIRYYNNDQSGHRRSRDGASGTSSSGRGSGDKHTETENIVFATINAIVPAIYAKNPTAEFTPNIQVVPGEEDMHAEEVTAFSRCCEKLVNILANRTAAPGFSMKVKAKQAVIHAQLTNESWAEIGYTFKDQSSEDALAQVNALSTALSITEEEKEIHKIEGELIALEEKIDILQPEGPFVRFRTAQEVLVDCDSMCPEHSDANWMMYQHMFSTSYLNAVYGEAQVDGSVKSIYEPTHILSAGGEGSVEDIVNNFRLFDTSDAKAYGYEDTESFRRAQRTLCWVVWDKVTRRVYLFNDKNWEWPIWVWDDPYHLPKFFPLEKLSFILPAVGPRALGEVSYYLDQQDCINDNNTEMAKIRNWARKNIFYNKNTISPDEFEMVMKGSDGTGRGLSMPEGTKINDHIFSALPPSANFLQLFENDKKIAAIDRISGTSVIMRNEQFKTNTTNDAIGAYTSANQTRLDDKIDTTEDWIGRIYMGVTMLCVQFMPKETVVQLLGARIGGVWKNMPPNEFDKMYPCRVEGGSTQKPTSTAKKKEATQMTQALGQFVNAAPGPVLEVTLRMLEKAFDEVVITASDWEYIRKSALEQMQRGNSTQGAGGGGEGVPAGAGPPGGGGNSGGNVSAPPPPDILAMIDGLPQNARSAFGAAVARGASASDTLKQIMDALQQAPQGNA